MDQLSPQQTAAQILVSREEALLAIAEGIAREEREKNDYYGEKVTLKLVAFHKSELDLMRQYVEMKLYYPSVAAQIERLRPELLERWNAALPTGGVS